MKKINFHFEVSVFLILLCWMQIFIFTQASLAEQPKSVLKQELQKEPLPNTDFQQFALQIPNALQKSGISQVGILDINLIQQLIKTVRWAPLNAFVAGSGEMRVSAVYLVEKRIVYVNMKSWRQTPDDMKSLVALHEAFGALGYNDENYSLSLALSMAALNQPLAKSLPAMQIQKIETRTQEPVYRNNHKYESGGITSIGGGGDWTALDVKKRTLNLILKRLSLAEDPTEKQNLKKILTIISNANFEPNWDSNTTIKMSFKLLFLKSGLRIEVPSILWLALNQFKSESQTLDLMIVDLLKKIERNLL